MTTKQNVIDPIAEAVDAYGWVQYYLGAFAALRIEHPVMATQLAKITTTDDEAIRVVAIMRDGTPGDRVYPALAWLMAARAIDADYETRARKG